MLYLMKRLAGGGKDDSPHEVEPVRMKIAVKRVE